MTDDTDRTRRRERHEQSEALFHRLTDLTEEEARRILEQECADDPDLRDLVVRLLQRERGGGSHTEQLQNATRSSPTPDLQPGGRIGPYQLESVLGEGGMGVVYLAQQDEPVRRKVAIKALKHGSWGDKILARFENEKQALALMDHPGVAKVIDAGITDHGRPYFVMEYVAGVPVIEYCDTHHLGIRDRLNLFMKICDAVQHAHQKGIIHRDLKPSNVLVTLQDGKPVPKVIDFGIAKAVSRKLSVQTLVTENGQFIGTPEYMSPEQADADAEDIDTRSDIYSLGVLLYELMTGALPFDPAELRRAGLAAMQKVLKEQEAPRPSTRLAGSGERSTTAARNRNTDLRKLVLKLAGDLDWVILKALEKDRTRRYESASGFADDIRRHLNDEPVTARAPSAVYRAQKFVRRNKVAVSSGTIVALALIAGLTLATIGFVRASRERDRAQIEAEKATEIGRFLTEILTAVQPEKSRGRELTVHELLDEAATKIEGAFSGQEEVEALIRLAIGQAYQSLGHYPKAQDHLLVADQLARAELDEHDRSRLIIQAGLGYVAMAQGRYSESEDLLRAALDGLLAVQGDHDPHTLKTMNLLALVLMEQGKNAEAETIFRRVVPLRSEVFGEDDAETLRAVANLARVQLSQGRSSEAAAWSERAETRSRAVLGTNHPVTIYSMAIRAWYLQSSGDMETAGILRKEAHDLSRTVFGEEHPYTVMALHYLADHLGTMGRKQEARALLRETLQSLRETLGPTHPVTLSTMTALANHLPYDGEETGAIYREVYEICERELGSDDLATLNALNDLGIWHWRYGHLDEAEAALRRVVDARGQVLGESAGRTVDAKTNLSLVLHHQDRLGEAEALQREVLLHRLTTHADSSPVVASAQFNLGLTLIDLGVREEALGLFSTAHEIYVRSYGKNHRNPLNVASALAEAMITNGRLRDAERLLDDSLARSLDVFGENHIVTHELQKELGRCYGKTARQEEGERLLLDVWGRFAKTYGSDSARATSVGRSLAELYRAWGRTAEATKWADGQP